MNKQYWNQFYRANPSNLIPSIFGGANVSNNTTKDWDILITFVLHTQGCRTSVWLVCRLDSRPIIEKPVL